MKRIISAAIVAACAALAAPVAASAEPAVVLGFQVTGVDGGNATGTLQCVDADHAGHQATFPIGANADASLLTVGAVVGIRIERGTIVGTAAQPPCDVHLDDTPATDPEAGDAPEPEVGDAPEPEHQQPGRPVKGEPAGDGAAKDDGAPGQNAKGGRRNPFLPAFANRVWKFAGEADGFDSGQLSFTVDKLLNLPKRFASQDDALVDQAAIALVTKKTRIRDADGHKATAADLDDADNVRVEGKLAPPKKWVTDEDDQPVPTIRAKRVVILS